MLIPSCLSPSSSSNEVCDGHKVKRGSKSRTCVPCNKSFLSPKDLCRHRRTIIHGGAAACLWKCPEHWSCKKGRKGFSRLDNFKRHVISMHGDEFWREL